jgi:hypothetical protein
MAGEWEWLSSLFGGGGGAPGAIPMDPSGAETAPVGGGGNQAAMLKGLAGLQGAVAPPAVQPIMPTGSIKPPDSGNSLAATAASGQNLQKIVAQLLQHNVPGGLGSYINPRG